MPNHEVDESENNRPYKYLLSTEDGKIILSHEENKILGKCRCVDNWVRR
jgi:hypothetical protein